MKYVWEKEEVSNDFKVSVYSWRKWGQPKLDKPKELKGISKSFSVDFEPKKSRCQCFILENDLYIKHVDYFSPSWKPPKGERIDMPLEYYLKKYFNDSRNLKSFGYPDCWGSIVLKNECWIKIENIKQQFERDVFILKIVHSLFVQWATLHDIDWVELDLEWERFFESVCKEYKECIKN